MYSVELRVLTTLHHQRIVRPHLHDASAVKDDDQIGHPHTEQLKTVERYTRTKFGELEVVTTVTDPGAYAKPFTVKFRHTLRPGWELMEYICNENNQDVEHIRGPAGL